MVSAAFSLPHSSLTAIWATILLGDHYIMGAWLYDIRPPKIPGLL